MNERSKSNVFYYIIDCFNHFEKHFFRKTKMQHRFDNEISQIFAMKKSTLKKKSWKLKRQNVSLLNVTTNINVVDINSRSILIQMFFNCSNKIIKNVTYVFLLYDESTIVSFNCWIEKRISLKEIVKSNDEAKKSYIIVVKKKKFAAVLSEKTSEIFEIQIGTIFANTCVKLEIVYLNELRSDLSEDEILVTLSISIASRYGPNTLRNHIQNQSASAQLEGKGLKVRIEVSVSNLIIDIESRTHLIAFNIESVKDFIPTKNIFALSNEVFNKLFIDRTKSHAIMSYSTTVLRKDFVLLIKFGCVSMLKARVLMKKLKKSRNTFALQISFTSLDLFTETLSEIALNIELIFVINRSGSMRAGKLALLKQILSFSIQFLQQMAELRRKWFWMTELHCLRFYLLICRRRYIYTLICCCNVCNNSLIHRM